MAIKNDICLHFGGIREYYEAIYVNYGFLILFLRKGLILLEAKNILSYWNQKPYILDIIVETEHLYLMEARTFSLLKVVN